jgi:anti-sigma factor RsiW
MFVHLNDIVDGELAAEHREKVERHLEGCEGCRRELVELEALKRAASALPSEVGPDRDLWPEIDRRLDGARAPVLRTRIRVLAIAASLVAAVAVSWMMLQSPQAVHQKVESTTGESEAVQAAYEPASVDSVRREYREARQALERVVRENSSALAPETLQVIESNLELIDHAIAEIERALASNPDSGSLDRQLRLAYRQQIEMLRWAAQLAA